VQQPPLTTTSRPCSQLFVVVSRTRTPGRRRGRPWPTSSWVYGRQLQQPEDEQPADPLDVSAMTREQRDALKRRILAQHPELVEELTR
jgi:hypothetical protein